MNDMLLGNAWLASCRGGNSQSKMWPDTHSVTNLLASLNPAEFGAMHCAGFPLHSLQGQQSLSLPFNVPHLQGFPHGPEHAPADGQPLSDLGACGHTEAAEDGFPDTRPAAAAPAGVNKIFPRRKAGQSFRINSKPVVLDDKVSPSCSLAAALRRGARPPPRRPALAPPAAPSLRNYQGNDVMISSQLSME